MTHARLAFFAACSLLLAMPARAQVPFKFSSGSAAKASEVNANFEFLNSKIDAIPAGPKGDTGPVGPTGPAGPRGRGLIVVDRLGRELGTFITLFSGGNAISWNSNYVWIQNGLYWMVNPSGQFAVTPSSFVFNSTDCSGTPYLHGSTPEQRVDLVAIALNTSIGYRLGPIGSGTINSELVNVDQPSQVCVRLSGGQQFWGHSVERLGVIDRWLATPLEIREAP